MTTCKVCGTPLSEATISGIRDWEFGAGSEYSYLKCSGCGVHQLHPFPSLDELKQAYPEHYTAFLGEKGDRGVLYRIMSWASDKMFNRSFRKLIYPGCAVLDVGCGNGEFLLKLKKLGATRLVGIDFSEAAVALCNNRGIETFQGIFTNYQHQGQSFDAIFMINYIEHVLEPKEELQQAYKLLKPGAKLIGELPNFASIDRKLFGRFWGGNHVPRHTFQYDPQSLRDLLDEAGFRDIRIKQDLNPGHIVISIQNWLQRKQTDLADNPKLRFGRMRYFSLMLLLFLPLNVLFVFLGRSGVMRFSAERQ